MKIVTRLFIVFIMMGLACAQAGYAAQDGEQGNTKPVVKSGSVSGEITGITMNYISVVYGRDEETKTEYEALLPISSDMQLNHVQSLGDLKVGDTINVSYDESVERDESGKEKLVRKTKGINFLKSAVPEPPDPWIEQAKLEEKLEKEAAKGK